MTDPKKIEKNFLSFSTNDKITRKGSNEFGHDTLSAAIEDIVDRSWD